ncbi:hypothetical protein GF319_07560 [Candidatus Bathyarchaeota archaeon]|nr:hypothetical protein [Candidatus Bathyarchaeota archaeon]
MNTLYCGLDVHEEGHLRHNNQGIRRGPDLEGMKNEEIPDFLEPYQVEKVAMEASTYITPLHREITQQGYDITVSHPRKTKLIAESRLKNDKVDSKALAKLLRLKALPESYIPPIELGVEWLKGIGMEPVDCYLRLMEPFKQEILVAKQGGYDPRNMSKGIEIIL